MGDKTRREFLAESAAAAAVLGLGQHAQAAQMYAEGATNDKGVKMARKVNLRKPGVVSINVELGNGPADKGHDGLKRNLELAIAHGVKKRASYELKAVPGDSGLDLDNLTAAQVEWYAQGGNLVRDAGFIPVLLTFIGPAEEGVLSANYASSNDRESAKGLDWTLKLLELGGAARVKSVVGPGTVDEHFNENTVQLYDRWGQDLTTKILPKAKEYGVIFAPESLRKNESEALTDVVKFGKYVKKTNSPYFKMQLDTAHLRATYGDNYLKVLEEAIKDDLVEHLHISEWGPWLSAGNRGAITENTPVGKDMRELFTMLHRVGYKGTIGIEIPHPLFAGAVGRELVGLSPYVEKDPNNVLGKFAEAEQKASVGYVMSHYKATRAR